MVKNTPNYLKHQPYNLNLPKQPSILCESDKMESLYFQEEFLHEYDINGTFLNHSRISPNNRARLFSWLSQECSKQRISRYSYVLTCSYLDLYFMKRNTVDLRDYQLLALGALILATKMVQIQGKTPVIDLQLFRPEQLLNMQKKIVLSLDFFLNPPIYIQLLNNLAKIWDFQCQKGQKKSRVRYFQENRNCYKRLKKLYEKMDCLILFKRILDFDLNQVVVTLFYLQTKHYNQELNLQEIAVRSREINQQNQQNTAIMSVQNPEQQDDFETEFQNFLRNNEIRSRPMPQIKVLLQKLSNQRFPISDDLPTQGLRRTFPQLLSIQTYNRNGYQFFRQNHAQMNRS